MTFVQLADNGFVDCSGDFPEITRISIEGIAHQLAHLPRWCAATDEIYTVGQHSILVARVAGRLGLSRETCAWALLHDAAETITNDMPGPLKGYTIKGHLSDLDLDIFSDFDLPSYPDGYDTVDRIDKYLAIVEATKLFKRPVDEWIAVSVKVADRTPKDVIKACDAWAFKIRYQDPKITKEEFLNAWSIYTG